MRATWVKRLVVCAVALQLIDTGTVLGHRPRGPPQAQGEANRANHRQHGFPRGGRAAQIQSVEFNGITMLHEDLIHSMDPVQEKLDVTRSGIKVTVRFQFDEMLIHSAAKPSNNAYISIIHNATRAEVVKTPMRYDRASRSEIRGELYFDPPTRHKLRKECANATCLAQVTIANRLVGRASVIELGKLKFYKKKSNGKTGIKLLTYPRLVDSNEQSMPWGDLSWAWSAAFHFFLVLGAGLMLIVGSEAKRVYSMLRPGDDDVVASKRWLHLAFTCTFLYLGMCASRALDIVTMSDIVYVAPTAAVIGTVSLCLSSGPEEEVAEDATDEAEEPEDTKKTN